MNSRDKEIFISKLQELASGKKEHRIFCGFDGFTDALYKVVRSENQNKTEFFSTIHDFGEKIIRAAGLSADLEIIKLSDRAGGNAPILANALSDFESKVILCANLGSVDLHPVFESIADKCETINLGPPAQTIAFEFMDGKLMFGDNLSLKKLYKLNLDGILTGHFRNRHVDKIDLVCMVDWANILNCTVLWTRMFEFLKKRILTMGNPKIFIDLADISRKSTEELADLIHLINNQAKQFEISLGLNLNEARCLYRALFHEDPDTIDTPILCKGLHSKLKIHTVVIHFPEYAYAHSGGGIVKTQGKKVMRPAVLTGGGDNFNAGFCLAWLHDFSMQESLQMGMLFSAFYVEKGISISRKDIEDYFGYRDRIPEP